MPLAGTSIEIQGVERPDSGLADELAAFEERTGIEVRVPSLDEGELSEALSSESPPDVLAVPQPGYIQDLAAAGRLVDLTATSTSQTRGARSAPT